MFRTCFLFSKYKISVFSFCSRGYIVLLHPPALYFIFIHLTLISLTDGGHLEVGEPVVAASYEQLEVTCFVVERVVPDVTERADKRSPYQCFHYDRVLVPVICFYGVDLTGVV